MEVGPIDCSDDTGFRVVVVVVVRGVDVRYKQNLRHW